MLKGAVFFSAVADLTFSGRQVYAFWRETRFFSYGVVRLVEKLVA